MRVINVLIIEDDLVDLDEIKGKINSLNTNQIRFDIVKEIYTFDTIIDVLNSKSTNGNLLSDVIDLVICDLHNNSGKSGMEYLIEYQEQYLRRTQFQRFNFGIIAVTNFVKSYIDDIALGYNKQLNGAYIGTVQKSEQEFDPEKETTFNNYVNRFLNDFIQGVYKNHHRNIIPIEFNGFYNHFTNINDGNHFFYYDVVAIKMLGSNTLRIYHNQEVGRQPNGREGIFSTEIKQANLDMTHSNIFFNPIRFSPSNQEYFEFDFNNQDDLKNEDKYRMAVEKLESEYNNYLQTQCPVFIKINDSTNNGFNHFYINSLYLHGIDQNQILERTGIWATSTRRRDYDFQIHEERIRIDKRVTKNGICPMYYKNEPRRRFLKLLLEKYQNILNQIYLNRPQ